MDTDRLAVEEIALHKPVRDLRRTSRLLAAVILPVGPLAVAVIRAVLPYYTATTNGQTVDDVVADPGQQSVVLWAAFIAALTLLPGILAVGRLTRRRAPTATFVGVLLAGVGYLVLPIMVAADVLLWTGANAQLDRASLVHLMDSVHPTVGLALALFVLCHVTGTVVLGVAMWRSRAVPRWAAVATAVSQPLHFIALVILANAVVDTGAWLLNALGFMAASVAILRLSDDEWELPSLPRERADQGA